MRSRTVSALRRRSAWLSSSAQPVWEQSLSKMMWKPDQQDAPWRETVIGCSGLQQEAQEREVQFEALEADVCEGLVRWALAGVGPVREQQLRDLEAEAADHLGLLFVPSHGLTKQEDDAGEHGVPIFGGGLDICASFQ